MSEWHAGFCKNDTLAQKIDCFEARVRRVAKSNPQRPLFVLSYGTDSYVDVAVAMQQRLQFAEVVGTSDVAALGREAAPR